MDEVVFSASLRHKLKQRIKKSSIKKEKTSPADDDQLLDRRVQQTLASHQSDDHPTAEQCEQFFCSEKDKESSVVSDQKDVTRLLIKRFEPGVGKYQVNCYPSPCLYKNSVTCPLFRPLG